MTLDRDRCSDERCTAEHVVCPDCSSSFVTPRDNPSQPNPNTIIDHGINEIPDDTGVTEHDDGSVTIEYRHVCWDCGWSEQIEMTVERTEQSGDA